MNTEANNLKKIFNPNWKTGQFLAYLRTAFGISSQPEFAKRLNVSQFYLANIESGRTPIKFTTAWSACEILDIHPDFLISIGKNNRLPFTAIPGACRDKIKRLAAANPSAEFISFWPAIREVVLGAENNIDTITLISNSESVKSEIERLVSRLKRATSKPGKKAELARFMSVAPARVSEWLAGQEPGGENALKLLRWVSEQESQK